MTNKINFLVNAEGNGIKTEAKTGKHTIIMDEAAQMGGTDAGPNPLQSLLAALTGCENVTAQMAAKQMGFDLQGISFRVKGILDPRGFMGDPSVTTYFEKVSVKAEVKTTETEERIKELQEVVESRCPVYNTLKAAGIELEDTWVKSK
ncbi:OsmC-like protein [Paraliobacillus sp. PM-2]|uniref:OsmC family protein n=1 Tax=Paraliobacillus sp. PM-2 TaxID=1462524 RepID=UPI00061C2DA4|nr:OsmC family protein [Paraliobacillus sp. PM-2]CQR47430.1 OsmC-like protein [Paraliobacillus sp. PM-2]